MSNKCNKKEKEADCHTASIGLLHLHNELNFFYEQSEQSNLLEREMLQSAASQRVPANQENPGAGGHLGNIDDMPPPVMNCKDKGTLWMILDS